MKNCFTCKHYLSCNDSNKGVLYKCDNHKRIRVDQLDLYGIDEETAVTQPEVVETMFAREFDIAKAVADVIDSEHMVAPDVRVPDDMFPEAKNFFEFCTHPDYLGSKPYAWQAAYGIILFAEYCPDCSASPDWIYDGWNAKTNLLKMQQKMAFLEYGVCPYCKLNKRQLHRKKKISMYSEAALSVGQRSGKSLWAGDVFAYIMHRQIKSQNPVTLYGLKPNSSLHMTVCALTYGQAKDTLWDPLYGHLTGSPWFIRYHDYLKEVGHGEDIFNLKDSFVHYKHRKLMAYPAGPDKRVLRGRTRIAAGIDELGWFPNGPDALKLVKMNADEVYKALGNSLVTVRTAALDLHKRGQYQVLSGYFVNVSSPSSQRDKINELVSKSHGSRKIFGIIKPTWEMNPRMPYKVLAEEFAHDPVALQRDFGAQPPIANSPFINDTQVVLLNSRDKTNPIRIHYEHTTGSTTTRHATITKIKPSGHPCIMALDAGLSNNSFAVTLTSLRGEKVVCDLMVEVQPAPGIKLNYSAIYRELLSPIIEKRNVVLLVSDRWNSTKTLQDAESDHGIQIATYSLKYKDMVFFKEMFEDCQYAYPQVEWKIDDIVKHDASKYPKLFINNPIEHFVLQCLTVQDTGSQVLKGEGFTDDLLRSAMLGHAAAHNPDYRALLTAPAVSIKPTFDIAQSMTVRTYSGATGSASSQSIQSSSGRGLGTIRRRVG